MTEIQDQIIRTLWQADRFICLPRAFGFSVYQLGRDLAASIEDDGSVPYVLGRHERYRSTPLASCLLHLWHAGLLPVTASSVLRERLFYFRDHMPVQEERQPRVKSTADDPAWCVTEGASVWTTSMALIALTESRSEPDTAQDDVLLSAAAWLVRQQHVADGGGWAFQRSANSAATVPMTALALRALAGAWTLPGSAAFRDSLHASIQSGITFLKAELVRKRNVAYWEFDGVPSLTATVWALEAFRLDPRDVNHALPRDAILAFAVSQIPKDATEWQSECFVKEPRTNYAHQKTFYTFMPSLLVPLFEFGLSPLHPRVVNVMQRLIAEGQGAWRIREYDMDACSFTHAMALDVLVTWCGRSQDELVGGFLSTGGSGSNSAVACPVASNDRRRCQARPSLHRAYLLAAVMSLIAVASLSITPSVYTKLTQSVFPFLGTLFDNQWFVSAVTLVVGVPVTLFGEHYWRRYQERCNQ